MDFNTTIDLIIRDLDEAREIIDDLKRYPGVPALQVELAKSKCKSAGEVIALLKTLQNLTLTEENALQVTAEPVKKEIPVRKKATPEKPDEILPPPLKTVKNVDKPAAKPAGPAILADAFTDSSNSINEQLRKSNNEEDLAQVLKTKPISSLAEAIGLNDRFYYIREIFNGNKETYTQAISRLDKAESLSDAMAVIMSYTGDNNENEAVTQLLDLVKRKFPADE